MQFALYLAVEPFQLAVGLRVLYARQYLPDAHLHQLLVCGLAPLPGFCLVGIELRAMASMMEACLPWRLIASYSTASAVDSWPRWPWLWTGSMECRLDHVIGRAAHL